MKRNTGIEFLRFILMLLIITLHVIIQGGIRDASIDGSLTSSTYYLLEVIGYLGVDSFAIISGYVSSATKLNIKKIIKMWLQVFFYSFVISILFALFFKQSVGLLDLIKLAMPITFNSYWYFTSYFALFFFAPIINRFFDYELDEHTFRRIFIIIFLIFTIFTTISDPFKMEKGYSFVWLMVLFVIGKCVKKGNILSNKSPFLVGFVLITNIFITHFYLLKTGTRLLLSNTSPTIVFASICLVVLFSKINIENKILTKIASFSFGVYLFHLNPIIFAYFSNRFVFILNYNLALSLLLTITISVIIYVLGSIVEVIRIFIFKYMKVDVLADFLTNIINKILFALSHNI